ncbi:MAG TPA: ribosome silencing factor [Elusimicrobiales bacterium]|nr:ribosome silencing factor [Elusimicrobiales bacterium]
MDKINFKKSAVLSARIAYDKKAKDIKVINIANYSSLAEFVVIASVESSPQIEAIDHEIAKKLKQQQIYKLYADGKKSKTWRVYDYGGFFVHIITKEERDFYGLDKVYHLGREVKWQKPSKLVKPAVLTKPSKAKVRKTKAVKPKKKIKKTAKKTVKKSK